MAGLAAKALGNGNDKPAAAAVPAERPKIGVPAAAGGGAKAEAPKAAPVSAGPPKVSMPTPAPAAPKAKAPTPAPAPAPKKPSPPPKAPKPQKPLDVERLKEEVATAVGGATTGFLVGTYLETQAAASSDEATLTAASGAAVLGLGVCVNRVALVVVAAVAVSSD